MEDFKSILRQSRISTDIKATYYFKGNEGQGRIVNMSAGGIALEVRQFFAIEDLVRVKFKLPDSDNNEVDFWGIVKSTEGSILGIKYEELSVHVAGLINSFMSKNLLQLGRSSHERYQK